MATDANVLRFRATDPALRGDHRFFLIVAILVAFINVAAFSMQVALGRSSFGQPWHVHLHAFVFFGWVALYLTQNVLVATGSLALHRRLGWIGAGWMLAMAVVGVATVVAMVRAGHVPFFFTPAYFFWMDVMALVAFLTLAVAGIRMRRRTEWHRRLMAGGMSAILGPAIGRLLPLPLLIPYAGPAMFPALLAIPAAGAIRDRRRRGAVHPAWWWSIAAIVAMQAVIELGARTAPGVAVVTAISAGSPGAAIDPLAYPPSPLG